MSAKVYLDDSTASHVIEYVASFVQFKHETVQVTEQMKDNAEFKTISPKGEVPVLSSNGHHHVGLSAVLKEVVASNPNLFGSNDQEKKETEKQLQFITKDFIPMLATKDRLIAKLHRINKDLLLDVFFVGHNLTVVDLAYFVIFHSVVKSWNENERVDFSNVTRWFDFVQHQQGIATAKYPVVPIKKNVVAKEKSKEEKKPEQKQEKKEEKKEEKKPEKKEETKKEEAKKEEPKKEAKQDAKKQEKKEEAKKETKPEAKDEKKAEAPAKAAKEQPKKEAKGGKAPAAPKVEAPVDVSRLLIKIGKIVSVKKHESADTLYVEQIDLGEEKQRTVVSGLVKFVPIEEMQNREVVVLCNLKAANMRGVKSEAMVLAASNSDHTHVELLTPPPGSKIGERVFVEGFPGEADDELNPKKKVWESVQPDFATNNECVACYKGIPFKTSAGVIKVKSIKSGGIK